MSKPAQEDLFKKVTAHCKEYGYVFQSSEIYDGLGAVYDYGPYGSELKKNIKDYWWRSMVQSHENIVGLDSAIFMHPKIWKASGHIDSFNDPLVDNKDSKKRYRADQLLEDQVTKLRKKGRTDKANELESQMEKALETSDLATLKRLIDEQEIVDPESGSRNWSDVRQFNLMFSTQFGSVAEAAEVIYLRPETAQGIFVNFLNVQKSARQKIPFGIAQIGKAFRNEIVARQFIFRMREFEQMEMQYFVRPGSEMEAYEYWKDKRLAWHLSLGTPKESYRFHDHVNLAHYANAAVDIEYDFPFGFKEVEGIHSRTDFDLKQHQEYSGRKQQYFDPEINSNYLPYVVETSLGADRMFLLLLCNAYEDEKLHSEGKEDVRTVLRIPPPLAPVKVAVLPLVKKDGQPEYARKILKDLQLDYNCQYDEKDAIGRRYRRQDAIGTPFCITIDHATLEDDSVTIRHRDSMKQDRIPVRGLKDVLAGHLDLRGLLGSL